MQIFIFQFKVKPKPGYFVTVKHGHAAVYIRAEDLAEATFRAHQFVEDEHWTILETRIDGHAINPTLHDLTPEGEKLLNAARMTGAAIGVAAVGFSPSGDGRKS